MADKLAYEVAIGSMFPGRKIQINGVTTQCTSSFDINLKCKTVVGQSTIPLYISVQFEKGRIVRNTYKECLQCWGQEETSGGLPLTRGQKFTIELKCKPEMFLISINGSYFCDYKYRLPIDTINNLTVTGDVTINDVILSGTPQAGCDDQIMFPNLLYTSIVPGMFPHRRIKIEGATNLCCTKFIIMLKNRSASGPSYTCPLFITVLFDMGYVIRNSFDKCLGEEEKCGGMPIVKGESFTIEIVCKPDVFTLIINGCHFRDYKHRLPYKTVNVLSARGDEHVKISDVKFSGTPPQQTWNDTIPHDVAFEPLC